MKILEWLLGTQELAGADWNFKFLGWVDYESWLKLLLLLVLVFMVYLTVRSYRREGDTSPRIKALLGAIRVGVILLIIAILLKPTIVIKLVKTLNSVIVVLDDNSQSMSFTDAYASEKNAQKQLCDYFKIAPEELAKRTRLDLYRQALLQKNGVLAVWAKDHVVKGYVASTTQPGKESSTRLIYTMDNVRAENDKTPFTGDVLPKVTAEMMNLKGDGYQTNIAEWIRNALDQTQGQRVQAIVVVGDGQPTTEDAENRLLAAMEYARQRGVPVYAVLVGDPTPPKDVTVVSLQAPREIRMGSEVEVFANLSQRNLDGQPATVELWRQKVGEKDPENWTPVDKQNIRLMSAQETGAMGIKGLQSVKFKLPPEKSDAPRSDVLKATEWKYVGVAYTGAKPEKKELLKKAAETLVRIIDSKINVLLVGGYCSWEFQYIRNLIQRQGDLYRLSCWQQNAEPEVSQAASSEDLRLPQMPSDLSDLMGDPEHKDPKRPGYQAIILVDPQPTKGDAKTGKGGFDAKFIEQLELFVREHRGGLCYVVGNKYSFTDEKLNLLGPNGFAKLQAMLPVEAAPNRQEIVRVLDDKVPEAWHAELTDYGGDHQITRIAETFELSQKAWKELPGIYWSQPVAKIKPAARVLLENQNPSRATARGEREPLVALHMYGSGPVIYVGTNETWRWRALEDAKFHKHFWNNIIGFLATLEASRVILTTGGDTFNVGERIKIEAEAYDEKYKPLTEKNLTVQVIDRRAASDDPNRKQTIKLDRIEKKPGRYSGEYVASRKGDFEITVPNITGVEAKRIAVRVPEAEAIHSEANEAYMKSLVNRDSDFMHLWEVDRLKESMPSGRLVSYHELNVWAWDKPYALILLITLLTIEWILRKKYNMA